MAMTTLLACDKPYKLPVGIKANAQTVGSINVGYSSTPFRKRMRPSYERTIRIGQNLVYEGLCLCVHGSCVSAWPRTRPARSSSMALQT
jgi:hypothetical protein